MALYFHILFIRVEARRERVLCHSRGHMRRRHSSPLVAKALAKVHILCRKGMVQAKSQTSANSIRKYLDDKLVYAFIEK